MRKFLGYLRTFQSLQDFTKKASNYYLPSLVYGKALGYGFNVPAKSAQKTQFFMVFLMICISYLSETHRYAVFKSVLLQNPRIFKAAQLKALLYLSGKILVASYKSANSYLFSIHCRLEPNLRSILSNFHHFLTPAHGNISNEYFNIFIPFFRYKTVACLAWVLRVLQHLQYWDNLLLSPPFGTRNFGTIYYCQHPQFKSPKYGCVQNCREIEIVER